MSRSIGNKPEKFKVTDDSGAFSIHECDNIEQAEQAHLLHFGLMYVNIESIIISEDNEEICKEQHCKDLINKMILENFGKI